MTQIAHTTSTSDERPLDENFDPRLTDEIKQQLTAPIRRIRRLLESTRTRLLQSYFDIGKIVREELDRLGEGGAKFYGRRLLAHIAKSVGIHPHILSDCLRLFDWGPDEFASIVAHERIGWGHLVLLLSVDTAKERAEYCTQIDAEDLTANEFAKVLQAKYGPRRPNSGRRPAIPKNVRQALGRLLGLAAKCHNAMSGALFSDKFHLASQLDLMPADNVTPEIRGQVVAAIAALKQLAEDLADAGPRLEKVLPMLDRALANNSNQQKISKEET